MKKIVLTLAFAGILNALFAQRTDSLRAVARGQMQQGNFDDACKTLALALKSSPDNLEVMKDQVLANLLKRDFGTALQIGQAIVQRPDADVQCYQLLGNTYKELAEYKEGNKMYKEGIEKFPKSGVLYSEYGDLLLQNNDPDAAIAAWEKGIQADVNNNGNYYYASKYYLANGNLLRGVLYGEIFVNIESYTQRTDEVKKLLFEGYRKLLAGNTLAKTAAAGNGFFSAVAADLNKNLNPVDTKSSGKGFHADGPNITVSPDSITIERITEVRWKFILDWDTEGNDKLYPYRLFTHFKQLVDYKIFDAYNQWLFGDAADSDKYQQWQTAHAAEAGQWMQMLHNIIFKIPAGQYYGN